MKHMVHNISKYLRICLRFLNLSYQKILIYRVSFILTTFTISLWLVASFVSIYIIYSYSDSFAGYSMWQYIGFMGFFQVFQNIFWFFFDTSLNSLSDNIFYGKIDGIITKPISSKFLASINEFDISSIPNIIFGALVLMVSLSKLDVNITLIMLTKLFIITICSVILFYSLFFSIMTLAFWAGRMNSVRGFLHTVLNDPGSIPTTAYRGIARFIASFIIPVALIATVPTSVLFFQDVSWKLTGFYILLTLVFYAVSNITWRIGLKNYSSVSS